MTEFEAQLSRKMQEELLQKSKFIGLLDSNRQVLFYVNLSSAGSLRGANSVALTIDLGQPEAAIIRRDGLFAPHELLDRDLAARVRDKVDPKGKGAPEYTEKILAQAAKEIRNG